MSNLTKCPDCGNDVSINATTCPKCGSPLKKSVIQPVKDKRPWVSRHPVLSTFGAVWILMAVISAMVGDNNSDNTSNQEQQRKSQATKTDTNKVVAKKELTEEEKAEKELKDKLYALENKGAQMAITLRKMMKDPDSFVLEEVVTKSDTFGLCFSYRSKNGFGGYSEGSFVISGDGQSTKFNGDSGFDKLWNKECVGEVYNLTRQVKFYIKQYEGVMR
jgi:hypothetical protein